MSHIFDMDNPFFSIVNKMIDYIFVSLLWLIFSIPIITIGVSTTALYYTTNKVIRNGRGEILPEFWGCFRSCFKQSTYFWILFLGAFSLIYMDIMIIAKMFESEVIQMIYKGIFFGAFFFCFFCMLYSFPYISRFSATNKMVIFNVIFLLSRHMVKTLCIAFVSIIAIVICGLYPAFLIFIPGVWAYIMSYIMESIFQKYMLVEQS